jgi:hypothetical protein
VTALGPPHNRPFRFAWVLPAGRCKGTQTSRVAVVATATVRVPSIATVLTLHASDKLQGNELDTPRTVVSPLAGVTAWWYKT